MTTVIAGHAFAQRCRPFPNVLPLRATYFQELGPCDDRPLYSSPRPLSHSPFQPRRHGPTPQEELYLVERARLHNLADGEYDKAISRLSKHFDSGKAFSRLRDASKARKLEAIPFAIKGYWRDKCRQIERSRRGYR